MNSLTIKILILICFAFLSQTSYSQTEIKDSEERLVYSAVEDYVLGLYNVEPMRIQRSVDTLLYKIGYYEYENESYNHVRMTYKQLFDLSGSWNKEGKQANKNTPYEIELYDINDKTASAKLTAKWGIDLMHLSKVDGVWKIMNIMWQSDPKKN